jgi:glyceraldehyde 3-phosphate dehydrogenase
MTINVAINGYGRIGRCLLRAIYENQLNGIFKIVAINDLGSVENNAHLTTYDTSHGKFNFDVSCDDSSLIVKGEAIKMFSQADPYSLPWSDLNVDLVFECTGLFTSKEKCKGHLKSGAKKVLISAPGGSDIDATIVYGVNHNILHSEMSVISNASCTTNCLAPIVKSLHKALGIKRGLMTTIHSYTSDQSLVDNQHKDLCRARAAACNLIPTKTGAASAVGLILPELSGNLDGYAMRVPTINVSVVDLTFVASHLTSVAEVNKIIKHSSENELQGILRYNNIKLVSSDFNHNPSASIFDATQTRVNGDLVKVLSWYDNEWGFVNQMLRTAKHWVF